MSRATWIAEHDGMAKRRNSRLKMGLGILAVSTGLLVVVGVASLALVFFFNAREGLLGPYPIPGSESPTTPPRWCQHSEGELVVLLREHDTLDGVAPEWHLFTPADGDQPAVYTSLPNLSVHLMYVGRSEAPGGRTLRVWIEGGSVDSLSSLSLNLFADDSGSVVAEATKDTFSMPVDIRTDVASGTIILSSLDWAEAESIECRFWIEWKYDAQVGEASGGPIWACHEGAFKLSRG